MWGKQRWAITVFLTASVYFATLRLKGRSLHCQHSERGTCIYQGTYTQPATAGNVTHYQSPPCFTLWQPEKLPDTQKQQHLAAQCSLLLQPFFTAHHHARTLGKSSAQGTQPCPSTTIWITQHLMVPWHKSNCNPKGNTRPGGRQETARPDSRAGGSSSSGAKQSCFWCPCRGTRGFGQDYEPCFRPGPFPPGLAFG